MSRRSGILLFNSRGTRTRCQSGRRFNVNMGFTDDDRILIENLYILKVTVQKNLLKSFQIKVGLQAHWTNYSVTELFARLFCIVLPCIA